MNASSKAHKQLEFVLDQYRRLHYELLSGYALLFVFFLVLVSYLRRNRAVAFQGDVNAARKVILPAFEPLLRILCILTFLCSLFVIHYILTSEREITPPVRVELYLAFRQFIVLIVLIFMFQKSVSSPALIRTCLYSTIFSCYTVPIVWMFEQTNWDALLESWILSIVKLPLLIFSIWVFVFPPARASKKALREYCAFTIIYTIFVFMSNQLSREGLIKEVFVLSSIVVVWGSLYPLFIWRVLKADTEYWRGLGQRAVDLQQVFCQKQQVTEIISSEGYHLLIEMHRKYVIDFAYLDVREKIGVGSTAAVYKGVLYSKVPVAIKTYTPEDVTEESVSLFSNEAALCGSLQHPNIVKFYGMCVCPPSICLVSELCIGNLEDILKSNNSIFSQYSLGSKISYIIDAARAIAYIHSFSPAFIHRDIKPENFMVDRCGVAKLTDFGESRRLPYNKIGHVDLLTESNKVNRMTVRGTVDYMAPEVIQGSAGKATYGMAADIYSLGITVWDILNPEQEKYPGKKNHLQVYESVVSGERPKFQNNVPIRLQKLVESSWNQDFNQRPTAQAFVRKLEEIQEEIHGCFAGNSLEIFYTNFSKKSSFYGNKLVDFLINEGYSNTKAEAIRMGNAFLDIGIMHHCKHESGFDNSFTEYVFDEDFVLKCQNLSNQSQDDAMRSRLSVATDSLPTCKCKKFAQGLDMTNEAVNVRQTKKNSVLAVSTLTEKLLSHKGNSEFDGFDAVTIEAFPENKGKECL